jgi:hypothetical protein
LKGVPDKDKCHTKIEHFRTCYQSWLGISQGFQTFDQPTGAKLEGEVQDIRALLAADSEEQCQRYNSDTSVLAYY